jgi:AcrR family transcriptional regulator
MLLFEINVKLFIRDPLKTEIGQSIVLKSIELIDKLGFEEFTFKKLATEIETTEGTLYRYFENKQRLLHYLVDWYWTLINFQIDYSTNNIRIPEEKLKICLQLLSGHKLDSNTSYLNETALRRIVISQLDKTFLTNTVDHDYREGLLEPFKETSNKIARIVQEINPYYPFPHSLVSTIIHAANHQVYYTMHLPILSDLNDDPDAIKNTLFQFLEGIVMSTIKSGDNE